MTVLKKSVSTLTYTTGPKLSDNVDRFYCNFPTLRKLFSWKNKTFFFAIYSTKNIGCFNQNLVISITVLLKEPKFSWDINKFLFTGWQPKCFVGQPNLFLCLTIQWPVPLKLYIDLHYSFKWLTILWYRLLIRQLLGYTLTFTSASTFSFTIF